MKKVTRSIAAIAVIIGSFVVGGNAAFAISLPPETPTSTIPEIDFSGPGSFDISLDPDFDTHCEDEDGVSHLVIENNLSDTGIIPANRWVAVHLEINDEDLGWAPVGLDYPVFLEMEKGDSFDPDFSAPAGDHELTISIWISTKELSLVKAADFVADYDPDFQKTVSVDCSSDDPVETTEDTPEETTEDTPEETTEDTPVETTEDTPEETDVDDPIEGSPLFTG